MITEKNAQDAADALALRQAAEVLQRRSTKPAFLLKIVAQFLTATADGIRKGKGSCG
jgi:hypothetical protein